MSFFRYIFGITWKEYTDTMFDKNNFLLIFISLSISLIIGYFSFGIAGVIIAFLIWCLLIKLFGLNGSIIF